MSLFPFLPPSGSPLRAEAHAADVHPLPDAGAGERVPLQQIPDPPAPHRDSPHAGPDGAPDQDLVPEPAHEVEEGEQPPETHRPGQAHQGGEQQCRKLQSARLSRRSKGQKRGLFFSGLLAVAASISDRSCMTLESRLDQL